MAIVQMQRINICALKKNLKAILERLQELGAMETGCKQFQIDFREKVPDCGPGTPYTG